MAWLITLLGAAISAIAGLYALSEHPKAKRLLVFLTFFGALCSASGGVLSSKEDNRDNRALLNKTEEIVALNKNLASKSDEIAELHEKLAAKSEEIQATITGGDSFGYIIFSGGTDKPFITFYNKGPFPLYDVSLTIIDNKKRQEAFQALGLKETGNIEGKRYVKVSVDEVEQIQQSSTFIPVGNVHPQLSIALRRWHLPTDADQYTYSVHIVARNGTFSQHMKLHRVQAAGRIWSVATRVFKEMGEGKEALLLHESIDTDFPRDATGQVRWEEDL